MPRLYLPSTTTPLVTPLPSLSWLAVASAAGRGHTIPGDVVAGDVAVYCIASGGEPSINGPNSDGTWTQIRRRKTEGLYWVAAWCKQLTAADVSTGTVSAPGGTGATTAGGAGYWRSQDQPAGTVLAVTELADQNAVDVTPAVDTVAGGLHVAMYGWGGDASSPAWSTDPPTFVVSQDGTDGNAIIGWTNDPAGASIGPYTPSGVVTTTGGRAGVHAVLGWS